MGITNRTLRYFVERGDAQQVATIIEQNPQIDLDQIDEHATLLYAAVWCGHEEVVKLLIQKGASPTALSNLGGLWAPPLHATAIHPDPAHKKIAQCLIENGVSRHQKDAQGNTVIDKAIKEGYLRWAEELRALFTAEIEKEILTQIFDQPLKKEDVRRAL